MDNSIETVWTSHGYRIPKTPDLFNKIRKELTIFSNIKSDFPGPVSRVVCFKHDKDYIFVPYRYGEENWGKPQKIFKQTIKEISHCKFRGELRDYQMNIIDKTLKHFKEKYKSGLWSLGTGTGKTIMALYLICKLALKAMIVVHKQVLLDQWVDRIKHFIPNAKIGIIQGKNEDVENSDIIIGMVQTLSLREHSKSKFRDIGILLFDEVHTMCSSTFSEVQFKIQTKYTLGLSATLFRKDGFDKVNTLHIGEIICEMHRTVVTPEIVFYHLDKNEEIQMSMTRFGKTNIPALVTDIAKNDHRNAFITKILLKKVRENRKIIVFSDRVYQCERLNDFFIENCKENYTSATFIGKKKKEELDEAMKQNVLFATYGIFKEGVDCPELDTLVFATPKSDIIQAVGRILRQKNKNIPEVIDVIDAIEPFKMMFYKRNSYYKSKGYKITHISENFKVYDNKENSESIENSDNHKIIGFSIKNDD